LAAKAASTAGFPFAFPPNLEVGQNLGRRNSALLDFARELSTRLREQPTFRNTYFHVADCVVIVIQRLPSSTANPPMLTRPRNKFRIASVFLTGCFLFSAPGCEVERRKSDAELGLNPQQISGRHIFDQNCERCHSAYSSKDRKGPSLKGVFHRQYLTVSGMPANDERVTDIVRMGRNNMEGFSQVLTQEQINDLLAYLHTL
jgi:hypothetical protein